MRRADLRGYQSLTGAIVNARRYPNNADAKETDRSSSCTVWRVRASTAE
jgi:hypothetical protein